MLTIEVVEIISRVGDSAGEALYFMSDTNRVVYNSLVDGHDGRVKVSQHAPPAQHYNIHSDFNSIQLLYRYVCACARMRARMRRCACVCAHACVRACVRVSERVRSATLG